MTEPGQPRTTGEGNPAERLDALRFALPTRRTWHGLEAVLRMALHPARMLAIFQARLTGKRLRARQSLAALVGIDHRLMLPPIILDRFPPGEGLPEDGDIIVLGGPGHSLVKDATVRIAAAFGDPSIQAVYGDALVQFVQSGPVLPLLRPTFDPALLMGVDYIGPVLALRRGALAGTAPTADITAIEAAFRIAERFGRASIGHLPQVLSLWRPWMAGDRDEIEPCRQARLSIAKGHLDRTGQGEARLAMDNDGVITVEYPLPEPTPLVSLIVPTRDRLDLLRPCIASLSTHTDWPALEILICDNDSREPETLAYLRGLETEGQTRIVPCPGPFNFAAMNNAAAALARGTLLVFVNNDVEAFEPDWLARMAREALRPDVGAVGAKLLDGEGRIQHGGVVLGTGGLVTHGHRHFPGDAPGYLSMLRATHTVSAVTAACLAVEAGKFAAVGGFDAENFAVDFNDVDLCLRLDRAGYRTLLVPAAVLHHREAASRRWTPETRARHDREVTAFRKRWGPLLAQDPHSHPGFDPDLSTHARLRAGFPSEGAPAAIRRPPY